MKKPINVSYKGTILSVNANGKVVVSFYELHDKNRHKNNEFKVLTPNVPTVLPLLDPDIKAIAGHPVCMDIVEEDDFFLVTIEIPGYSGTSKIAKKEAVL